jgi:hypothetical protein
LVCLDINRNGRCEESEAQTYSGVGGIYQLAIPRDSTAPLVAEVIAGRSRDSDRPQSTVDVSYRMASPSRAYSTDITPFSTLVQLTAQADYPLAEDLVRGLLGLPPKYDIKLAATGEPGSLQRTVAKSVVAALKANGAALDLSAPDALARVVASFPAAPPGTVSRSIPRKRMSTPPTY